MRSLFAPLRFLLLASFLTAEATMAMPSDVVVQTTYLKASNPDEHDGFGHSAALSGDTLVVGAPGEGSNASGVNGNEADNSLERSGAVYVFVRVGNTWVQEAYLKASNPDRSDAFGSSVAIDGDTIVVGAAFEESSATGVDSNQADNSFLTPGAAYVFTRTNGVWSQSAYLKASNTGYGDTFGSAVGISGDTIVVTAIGEESNAAGVNGDQTDDSLPLSGAAYVFHNQAGAWIQQAYIKSPYPGHGDLFGYAVAIDDDTLVVGAYREDGFSSGVNGPHNDNTQDAGAAYIYVRNGTTWTHQAYVKASNPQEGDNFGVAVGLDGDTLVVGASSEDSVSTGVNGDQANNQGFGVGAVYVFTGSGANWTQEAYLKASNTIADYDHFGLSVGVSGDTIVVGAEYEDSSATGIDGDQTLENASHSGAAYVFHRSREAWAQVAYVKASNTDANDGFSRQVLIDSDLLAVTAPGESSGDSGVNGDQADNSLSSPGACYTFEFTEPVAIPLCLGNGNQQSCPCGNATPTMDAEGCANSSGSGARLAAAGSNVVATDDLTLTITGAVPGQPSLVVQGSAPIALPFRDGILCTGNPTERLELVLLDAAGSGTTIGSVVANGAVSPGDVRYYQQWYRDPGGVSPCGFGSNLSNALLVVWQ